MALDVIMAAAFGIRANYQTDPDDPTVARTNAAMNQTPLVRVLMALMFLLPFGHKLMHNSYVTGFLFKSFIDFKHMAQEMIELKRNEKILPGRKVTVISTDLLFVYTRCCMLQSMLFPTTNDAISNIYKVKR